MISLITDCRITETGLNQVFIPDRYDVSFDSLELEQPTKQINKTLMQTFAMGTAIYQPIHNRYEETFHLNLNGYYL